MSVALELTVEQPFSLTTTLAGPPRAPQLLLPSGGLSTAAALGGGGVEGRAALPLRSRCMLTAALRATAPCEVRCCTLRALDLVHGFQCSNSRHRSCIHFQF